MRQIVKFPLKPKVQESLALKQQNINDGIAKPKWKPSKEQRKEIRNKLLPSQKHLCCYCECEINKDDCHIEHFYEQSDREDLIYDYEGNMILSCNKNTCCGHYKGETNHNRISVDYDRLLNPIKDNSKLLKYNNIGEVEASTEIELEIKQVDYTILRLNLNGQNPRNKRLNKINRINKQITDEKMNLEQQKQFLTSLLDENQTQLPEYYSTIKDYFGFILAL